MKHETFTANTLAKAQKAKERWLTTHKGVIVKSEHTLPELQKPAGRFAPKGDAKVGRVSIKIEYEDSN
jgi:hypothetical protein